MRDNYDLLKTEERNPRTMNIDKLSTHDMIQLMNNENRAVEDAIDTQIDCIAAAVDMISDAMAEGGHLIYVGAGTSGRLGVVDASGEAVLYATGVLALPETNPALLDVGRTMLQTTYVYIGRR